MSIKYWLEPAMGIIFAIINTFVCMHISITLKCIITIRIWSETICRVFFSSFLLFRKGDESKGIQSTENVEIKTKGIRNKIAVSLFVSRWIEATAGTIINKYCF